MSGKNANGKSAVILGAASTAARYVAHEFARAGYALALADVEIEETEVIARDVRVRFDTPCHALPFDALDFGSHEAFADQCAELLGGEPEGVVLCFGYMPEQADAEADFALVKRSIDVNFTGAASILEIYARRFAARKHGFIGAISSVAGDRGRKTNYLYGSAKAGFTAYLSGLRNRLQSAKVSVTTIKPGFMDTKMTYGMPLPGPLVASPQASGRAIFRAVTRGKNEAYILFFWRYIMLIIRHIPEFLFKRMSI